METWLVPVGGILPTGALPWLVAAIVGAGLVALALLAAILVTPVYKHIVCLKYLFCGWKAVVPFISALPAAIGVFLLILVFAIMDGFVLETSKAVRGTLSDIIVDGQLQGVPYYDEFIEQLADVEEVQAATPIIRTYALVRIKPRLTGVQPIVRECLIIGIRPGQKAPMGQFRNYLEVRKGDAYPPEELLEVPAAIQAVRKEHKLPVRPGAIAGAGLIGTPWPVIVEEETNEGVGIRVLAWVVTGVVAIIGVFVWRAARRRPGRAGWRWAKALCGLVVMALAVWAILTPVRLVEIQRREIEDVKLILYGDDLVVSTIPIRPSGAVETEPGGVPRVSARVFTLVDTFKSGFWENDSKHLYVGFDEAQAMAGMEAQPEQNLPARASQIHINIRDPSAGQAMANVIRRLWDRFAAARPEISDWPVSILTWETYQGQLLSVVKMERNITVLMLSLMFLGFAVLTALISYVMAYIKRRDVGILKAVGASDVGVGSLFLGYGFAIGFLGVSVGLAGALLMLDNLDAVELWVNQTLGVDVFPRDMYYFEHIPRNISPQWCAAVALAVLALSTLASTAGGLLAAMKQPVETLRYE